MIKPSTQIVKTTGHPRILVNGTLEWPNCTTLDKASVPSSPTYSSVAFSSAHTYSSRYMIPKKVTILTGHLECYLKRQIELYKDRFEQEPSDAMLGIFVQRFMDENYPEIPEEE